MCGRLDTGLVLVVFMTLSMVLTVVCLLSLVQYQHCPVLFPNNTVSGVLSTSTLIFLYIMVNFRRIKIACGTKVKTKYFW